jgi:4-amino-4-deoxy-L-arabinose transferase-like glycosyltransferase
MAMTRINAFLQKNSVWIIMASFMLLTILVVLEMIHATPFGPAFGSDSVTYMESAKNFIAGKGLGLINADGSFTFLPYTPPLYPLILSMLVLTGVNLVQAAFWLNVTLFIIIIYLLGWCIWYLTRSGFAAVLLGCLLALSPDLIGTTIFVMSDTLCLTMGISGMVLLLIYLRNNSRKVFYWSAVFTGLACLTRFAGVAFCITGVMAVILLGGQDGRKRLIDGLIYFFLSSLPLLIWILIDMAIAGAIGSRSIQPLDNIFSGVMDVLRSLKETIYQWLPYIVTLSQKVGQATFRIFYICMAILSLGLAAITINRLRKRRLKNWLWTSGINIALLFCIILVIYLLTIIFSYSVFYPRFNLYDRLFMPINVSLLVLLSLFTAMIFREYRKFIPRLMTIISTGLLVLAFYSGAQTEIARLIQFPSQYTTFKDTGIIAYLKQLPESTPMVSNRAPIIQYYIGRPAYPIKELFSEEAQELFLPYGSDMTDETQRIFRDEGGALVLFWMVYEDFKGMYGDRASERYAVFVDELFLAFDSPEGQVYLYKRSPSQ